MRLTDRQDSLLLVAAMMGGSLIVHEITTRCDWHVVGVNYGPDDRYDVEFLVAVGHIVVDDDPPRPGLRRAHHGPTHSYRLTTTGYRAAWNVSN